MERTPIQGLAGSPEPRKQGTSSTNCFRKPPKKIAVFFLVRAIQGLYYFLFTSYLIFSFGGGGLKQIVVLRNFRLGPWTMKLQCGLGGSAVFGS